MTLRIDRDTLNFLRRRLDAPLVARRGTRRESLGSHR
jgi:hypothetical protein